MTPTQLRTFAAIVRLGSSRAAASELGVSEAAVSSHVAALRKELGDPLVGRSQGMLTFTPGGLRLARRAVELLGLQDQTVSEVREAAQGRRVLQIAVSPIFGEYTAPGLIDLFSKRALDLDVEMQVTTADRFAYLLENRAVDLAFGPVLPVPAHLTGTPFLKYRLRTVAAPGHPLARPTRDSGRTAEAAARARWYLGPAATDPHSTTSRFLGELGVPEQSQFVFQSHAAAFSAIQDGKGLTLSLAHRLTNAEKMGSVAAINAPGLEVEGVWTAYSLAGQALSNAGTELLRFVSTPRAIQAMLSGTGHKVAHFKPKVHVTLWKS